MGPDVRPRFAQGTRAFPARVHRRPGSDPVSAFGCPAPRCSVSRIGWNWSASIGRSRSTDRSISFFLLFTGIEQHVVVVQDNFDREFLLRIRFNSFERVQSSCWLITRAFWNNNRDDKHIRDLHRASNINIY